MGWQYGITCSLSTKCSYIMGLLLSTFSAAETWQIRVPPIIYVPTPMHLRYAWWIPLKTHYIPVFKLQKTLIEHVIISRIAVSWRRSLVGTLICTRKNQEGLNLLLWYERAILEHNPRHKPTFSSLFNAERSVGNTVIPSSKSCITTAF